MTEKISDVLREKITAAKCMPGAVITIDVPALEAVVQLTDKAQRAIAECDNNTAMLKTSHKAEIAEATLLGMRKVLEQPFVTILLLKIMYHLRPALFHPEGS